MLLFIFAPLKTMISRQLKYLKIKYLTVFVACILIATNVVSAMSSALSKAHASVQKQPTNHLSGAVASHFHNIFDCEDAEEESHHYHPILSTEDTIFCFIKRESSYIPNKDYTYARHFSIENISILFQNLRI